MCGRYARRETPALKFILLHVRRAGYVVGEPSPEAVSQVQCVRRERVVVAHVIGYEQLILADHGQKAFPRNTRVGTEGRTAVGRVRAITVDQEIIRDIVAAIV